MDLVTQQDIIKPWERQPGEPWRAFSAFVIYRDLEDHERTLINCSKKSSRSIGMVRKWANEYKWDQRIALLIDFREKIAFQEKRLEREKMLKLQANYGRELLDKGMAAIRFIEVDSLSPKDAAAWVELGMKMERLARDLPTENVKSDATQQTNVNITNNTVTGANILSSEQTSKLACELLEQLTGTAPPKLIKPDQPDSVG